MLSKEEIKKWMLKNCINENGDLDLSCLDFSDFDGNVNISELKVKKSLNQSWQKVGGDLRQNYQEADGRIFYDFGSLNYDFRKMSPAEKGEFIFQVFGGDDGKVLIDNVDLSDCESDVYLSLWKVRGNLYQGHQKVKGDLFQNNQKVGRNLFQDEQEAKGFIAQDMQEAKDECVEPDYEAEYERLRKELDEANRKNETLMWALEKAKEASK